MNPQAGFQLQPDSDFAKAIYSDIDVVPKQMRELTRGTKHV